MTKCRNPTWTMLNSIKSLKKTKSKPMPLLAGERPWARFISWLMSPHCSPQLLTRSLLLWVFFFYSAELNNSSGHSVLWAGQTAGTRPRPRSPWRPTGSFISLPCRESLWKTASAEQPCSFQQWTIGIIKEAKKKRKQQQNKDIKASSVAALKDWNDKWVIKQFLFGPPQLLFYMKEVLTPLIISKSYCCSSNKCIILYNADGKLLKMDFL